ncbi:MAG: endopeptidase La [Vicinamibacteria bacterium]|nr:endopeptidase La [Vicinamibacteria bacterium]
MFGRDKAETIETMAMVPLRDVVVFPHMMVPFVVGRRSSIKALDHAVTLGGKRIFLSAQHEAARDNPSPDQIYGVGTVCNIVQSLKLPDGNVKVLVEGVDRGHVIEIREDDGFFRATVKIIPRADDNDAHLEPLVAKATGLFEQYVKLSNALHYDAMLAAVRIEEPCKLADTIAAHIVVDVEEKQRLLEIVSPRDRLTRIIALMESELEKLQVDRRIQGRVKRQMERAQKEYYLNEQMKAIQKELGRKDERSSDADDLRKKIEQARMSAEAHDKALQELKRLDGMPPMSAEATVSRNFLEWLVSVPWHKRSRERRDLTEAERILNEDHYSLEKVKERIVEFLAVRQLVDRPKGPILCFVGPPGVGKTSLARSIARCTSRKFVRMSLGGVRDEAEIRGHRRTYIGAFPGQIIQMMKKAQTRNPVFLLDEVDKMSMDFRGDPSAALLEVLDPEQNHTFTDHYLDVEYDLSAVLFIATANVLHTIPQALQDRLEVIRLPGYTELEKLEIARRHLIPKQIKSHGLSSANLGFNDEAVRFLIRRYTREAGVRNLEREITSICRKVARKVVAEGRGFSVVMSDTEVREYLGVPRFHADRQEAANEIGMATGLAWTEVGGEILTVEVTLMPGKGALTLTGKLGDVMQESGQAAMSFVRSRAQDYGIQPNFNRRVDVHIHVPEGAIPKDGPSAGITMATALVSSLTKIAVRRDVAMTGEITLRGKVLPIGGVKEKILAAHRIGVATIILPRENEKDLSDIPQNVMDELHVELVDHVDDVLRLALVSPPSLLPGVNVDRPADSLDGVRDGVTH